jgi:SAM-dependent methyltransferase
MAESFGVDAERYDRARPRYPDAIVEWVVSGSPGPDLLDVGTGTGIAARQFLAAGCRVHGVEPDARMADFARRAGFEVDKSTFEAWDPAGRDFDAVVAAMAWHWVDPFAGAAKAAQVLRPGGLLAVFWNAADTPPEITAAFAEVYARVLPGSFAARAYRTTKSAVETYAPALTKSADGMRAADAFGEPAQWRFDWDQHYTRDEWLDLTPTNGAHTRLAPDDLAAVLDGLGTVIDAHGGGFTVRYTTMGVAATRRSPG